MKLHFNTRITHPPFFMGELVITSEDRFSPGPWSVHDGF